MSEQKKDPPVTRKPTDAEKGALRSGGTGRTTGDGYQRSDLRPQDVEKH